MDKEETLAFIDKQIEMELNIIRIVEENVSKLGNAFIKDLLIGISTDSKFAIIPFLILVSMSARGSLIDIASTPLYIFF